jgi:nitrite reductase/ring-hydroxylating ferredoxin subunit
MANAPALFAHRRNEDGSYDSICRACFAALVRSKPEPELAAYENAHNCDSSFLAERGYFNRAECLVCPAHSQKVTPTSGVAGRLNYTGTVTAKARPVAPEG